LLAPHGRHSQVAKAARTEESFLALGYVILGGFVFMAGHGCPWKRRAAAVVNLKTKFFAWHFTARSLFKKFATSARDRLIHWRLCSLEKERSGATKIVSGLALSR
jgi:hypothetical protein